MDVGQSSDASGALSETVRQLESKISDRDALLALLASPLKAFGLLPPRFVEFSKEMVHQESPIISRHVTKLQITLLEHVVPVWYDHLREDGLEQILFQFFCPDIFLSSGQAAAELAMHAHLSLCSVKCGAFELESFRRLHSSYPLDRLHTAIFSEASTVRHSKRQVLWEDVVRCIISVPSRVANSFGSLEPPPELRQNKFYSHLCLRVDLLVSSIRDKIEDAMLQSVSFVLVKLVNAGVFHMSTTPSLSCGLADIVLRRMRARINCHEQDNGPYFRAWQDIFGALPTDVLSKFMLSFVSSLAASEDDFDPSEEARGLINREARMLIRIFGLLGDEEDEKWDAIVSCLISRSHSLNKARTLVCWASASDEESIPPKALQTLLQKTATVWTSSDHIRYSLLSYHQYLSALMLLTLSSLPKSSISAQSLAFSHAFIESIGIYLTHLDQSVRRCGMLVAEVAANVTGKTLDFDQWSGQGSGQEWARSMRELVRRRDIDSQEAESDVERVERNDIDNMSSAVIIDAPSKIHALPHLQDDAYDSDDSLEGYASDDASESSPTPSELDEIEHDPTTHVGRKKISRPVYLIDLAGLIMGSTKPDDPQNANRIEMALDCAEDLIRKKSGFGFELEENAVNLVYALVGLNNNYELDDFDEKRQNALNALVSLCPRKAAPALIDEFFKNQYSTTARFAILNALAFGARELAGLSGPHSNRPSRQNLFPSKRLPDAQHARYLALEVSRNAALGMIAEEISQKCIDSTREAIEPGIAPLVRERQLRIRQPQRVVDLTSPNSDHLTVRASETYSALAAEYFVGPFIGKYWLFLRDEKEREERTSTRTGAYHGAGTGLILNPLTLSASLNTLLVLVQAAQHSPAFLSVLAPDALELAFTVSAMPLSRESNEETQEASVLNAALETAVVIMDGCINIDGGRTLSIEHTLLLQGVRDWAGRVMEALEYGLRFPGEGGVQESRIRRSVVGVVLKTEQMISRWGLSMLDVQ